MFVINIKPCLVQSVIKINGVVLLMMTKRHSRAVIGAIRRAGKPHADCNQAGGRRE